LCRWTSRDRSSSTFFLGLAPEKATLSTITSPSKSGQADVDVFLSASRTEAVLTCCFKVDR
jgi:hypothetical protein